MIIVVREATFDDRAAILSWYNDPLRQAFNKKPYILSKDAHKEWFDSHINNNNKILLIGLIDIIRMGAVIFKRRQANIFSFELMIRPPYFGKGHYKDLLLKAVEVLNSKFPGVVVEKVVNNFQPSIVDVLSDPRLTVEQLGNDRLKISINGQL